MTMTFSICYECFCYNTCAFMIHAKTEKYTVHKNRERERERQKRQRIYMYKEKGEREGREEGRRERGGTVPQLKHGDSLRVHKTL